MPRRGEGKVPSSNSKVSAQGAYSNERAAALGEVGVGPTRISPKQPGACAPPRRKPTLWRAAHR
eukprot:2612042-Alexandrium_andersonii.AAC.1